MPRCPNPRCQTDYPDGTIQCTNTFCRCLLPEAVIAGRYRIETLIGMGGMGTVYRASDTFETQQVAIKILSTANPSIDEETAAERFRREARYAHQLTHINIVPVLNFGQDGKLLFLVMPLVTGGTLKSILKQEHPLPTPQIQRYLSDLAAAIDAIHEHPQEIIHRDIKPSNLLIHQDDGRLVVTDFGIARAVQHEKPLTQRGWSIGTEHYIAPEQEHGKAEPVSDIYAMGVVAYQMFTGLLPFQAVVKKRATELPAPSTLNKTLPAEVDPIILRAMDIDPKKRYTSGQEFVDALNAALAPAENPWEAKTVADTFEETIVATNNANIIIRTIIPENPCGACGRENKNAARFCRHCGQSLSVSPLATDICQVGYGSDTGLEAQENEDMLLVVQGLSVNLTPPPRPFSLLAVADGLRGPQGKSARGHEASRLAVETVADIMLPLLTTSPFHTTGTAGTASRILNKLPPPDSILEQWLRDAVRQANQVIYHCNADYDTTMASTLTIAILYKHHLYIASVGDSRAYYYNAQKGLQIVTTDHTLAANLVAADLLQPDEVYDSPKRHQHYRYLGQNYPIMIDLFQYKVEVGDLILLCTDGLWHMLRDERIQELLTGAGNTQLIAHTLVEAANQAGGEGNISAIVARVL